MRSGELDTRIADCLQVNGRASWTLIAEVLGEPERTVARRGQQLLDSGLVRVSAYLDEARLTRVDPLLVRVKVDQGATATVAAALAKRKDAYSVTAFPSSSRVEGLFMPAEADAVELFADQVLTELSEVRTSELTRITKFFRRGHEWHGGRLDAEVLERLKSDIAVDETACDNGFDLSEQDWAIAHALVQDGRSAVTEIARTVGGSSQLIGRRMRALFRNGLLQMRTEVSAEVSGLGLEAHLRLSIDAAGLDRLGSRLVADPAVLYCVAMTGSIPLECIVKLPSLADLYDWIATVVGSQPGAVVADCNTEPRQYRRANILFDPSTGQGVSSRP